MLDIIGHSEYRKKELQLSINSFDNPTELSGPEAWAQLILQLLFLEPGSYPTYPDMGIGLENYQFDYLDDVIRKLSADIIDQQSKYLPDIPLVDVSLEPRDYNGEKILMIYLTFNSDMNGNDDRQVIAINATPTSRHFLDFEVSW